MTERPGPAGPPWGHVFKDPADPARAARIRLSQVDRKAFELESALLYTGPTGVAGLPVEARTLHPDDLGPKRRTDLASVPAALTWLVSPYGVHTPAALLHDRLIGEPGLPGVSDVQADRYFRFMLQALGVRWLRRWLMWSAVTFGTRWRAGGWRRALVMVWVVLAAGGMGLFAYGVLAGSWTAVVVAALGPVPASALWGRQFRAALLAAATAIWVLPPTVIGAAGFWVYAALEHAISAVASRPTAGDEPIEYGQF